MTDKQYIWIRNVALIIILCNILYFRFSFAPIYWRIAMLILGGYMFFHVNLKKITLLEKLGLSFLAMNILCFMFGNIWLKDPTQTQLGNIIFCMFSMFIFCRIGIRGFVTKKFVTVAAVCLVLAAIPRYYHDMNQLLDLYVDRERTTINISTLFMTILPMSLIIKKKYSLPLLFICISFIIAAGKRGNAVAAVIPVLLFVVLYIKESKRRLLDYILISVAFIITYQYAENLIVNSEFLQQRIQMTLEGYDSNRSIIYAKCWDTWYNSDSFVRFMFGYGWDGTIRIVGIRAHNDWLELLVDNGLMGTFLYLLLLLSLVFDVFKVKKTQHRFIILAVFSIWFIKSLVSMGYSEEYLAIIFIPLGFVFTDNNSKE